MSLKGTYNVFKEFFKRIIACIQRRQRHTLIQIVLEIRGTFTIFNDYGYWKTINQKGNGNLTRDKN